MNKRFFRGALLPIAVIALVIYAVQAFPGAEEEDKPTWATLYEQVDNDAIESIKLNPESNKITVTPRDDDESEYVLGYSHAQNEPQQLFEMIGSDRSQLEIWEPQPVEGGSFIGYLAQFILPLGLLLVGWFFIMNYMQSGGGGQKGIMGFGKSRARQMDPDAPKVTFDDVAGVSEAIEELSEIRDFLENPKKFQNLGARIPKGVLLFGPPGTGKTLLARAVAGEAGVPFFSISGSDFVEMFVGVGASRVRDLFEQAKTQSPCIIFVDEIDAVGRHRGTGMGGGNDEREQTLNQLLVEMDGFAMSDNIIVIAATNRPDILDPALLRPGRFDRQIRVDVPDRPGREAILGVHSAEKPLDASVDLGKIAGQTAGFTGADLENLVNEAALLAARRGKKKVTMPELEEGIMRVIVGPEKRGRVMSDKEKRVTAVHEMGHAFCAHFLEHADPPHKISIVGRGMALGYVVSIPAEDRYTRRKVELMATLAQALGGRTAEEIVFGEFTTGAENDLKKVTEVAKKMVMKWGMSDALGPRAFGGDNDQPFLGREIQADADYSDDLAHEIDQEIKKIIDEAHGLARDLLAQNRELLEKLADILVEHETMDADQFVSLIEGASPDEVFVDLDEDGSAVLKDASGEKVASGAGAADTEDAPPADESPTEDSSGDEA